MRAKKFWADYGGAITAAFSLLTAMGLGLAGMVSLFDPQAWWVWTILGSGFVGGLFWQAIAPRRELNAIKDVQAKVEKLSLYDDIEITHYQFPWNEHQRSIVVNGASNIRIGLRVRNRGKTDIIKCRLKFVEAAYNGKGYQGQEDKWYLDPVGTEEFGLLPQTTLERDPDYSAISRSGGSAIFTLADRLNPSSLEFHYMFSGGVKSSKRQMEGQYCAQIQLEGIVKDDGAEVGWTPLRFWVRFTYRNRVFSRVHVIRPARN